MLLLGALSLHVKELLDSVLLLSRKEAKQINNFFLVEVSSLQDFRKY